MKPTELTYLDQSYKLTDTATVLDISTRDDGKILVILDKTIFYPQGGGQPYDQGTIDDFVVEEVRFKDGIVYHCGTGSLTKGATVTLKVNKERRELNSNYHTAGHIIDIALRNCGITLIPTSGYHFPQGAYVEYDGTLDEQERESLQKSLQEEVTKLVEQDRPVHLRLVTPDELAAISNYVPEYIPKDKPSRAMIIEGYPAIPCGGTHAKTTKIGRLTIVKIKNKSGKLRISYEVT
jgi:Ser-tRNA(Ala) deacylase AlaX